MKNKTHKTVKGTLDKGVSTGSTPCITSADSDYELFKDIPIFKPKAAKRCKEPMLPPKRQLKRVVKATPLKRTFEFTIEGTPSEFATLLSLLGKS